MTWPTEKSLAARNGRLGLRERLVARRVHVMGGRVSEFAADRQVRALMCRLVVYLGVLPLTAAAVSCSVLDPGAAAFGCWAAATIWIIVWSVAAYWHGRAACLDIVRAAGLPDHAWRKVRADTPEKFDAWLARAQAAKGAQP